MTWRRLDPPRPVAVFVAENWHETTACAIDEETRELRVHWPPSNGIRHLVVDAARYRFLDAVAPVSAPARA